LHDDGSERERKRKYGIEESRRLTAAEIPGPTWIALRPIAIVVCMLLFCARTSFVRALCCAASERLFQRQKQLRITENISTAFTNIGLGINLTVFRQNNTRVYPVVYVALLHMTKP